MDCRRRSISELSPQDTRRSQPVFATNILFVVIPMQLERLMVARVLLVDSLVSRLCQEDRVRG